MEMILELITQNKQNFQMEHRNMEVWFRWFSIFNWVILRLFSLAVSKSMHKSVFFHRFPYVSDSFKFLKIVKLLTFEAFLPRMDHEVPKKQMPIFV